MRECKLPVVGYKIGCASKESQALVGAAGPFAARIFAPTRFDSPAEISTRDFFTVGVEAEFGFTMRNARFRRAALRTSAPRSPAPSPRSRR